MKIEECERVINKIKKKILGESKINDDTLKLLEDASEVVYERIKGLPFVKGKGSNDRFVRLEANQGLIMMALCELMSEVKNNRKK